MIEKLRKNLTEKRKTAMVRFNLYRDAFEKKKSRIKADLEEAGRIWKELGERFKWWQELP
ncbi:MAG: hypothetical protein Q8O02_01095 [Candidatus Omnitrophota bacterium]|nr:hypothetical protein [Candidatus Omnitrophota bacterium]